jgi:hypothetical protein
MKTDEYRIYVGDMLIGLAKDVEDDMPNTIGVFDPTPEFEKVKALFDKEYALIKGPSAEWLAAKDEIFTLGLRVEHKTTGEVVKATPGKMPGPTFRNELAYIHIHDLKVWWRLM